MIPHALKITYTYMVRNTTSFSPQIVGNSETFIDMKTKLKPTPHANTLS